METGSKPSKQKGAAQAFPPLDQEVRNIVGTECAAFHLNRKPQTLRFWACAAGPIQPLRINGRLAWKTVEIRRLVGAKPQ